MTRPRHLVGRMRFHLSRGQVLRTPASDIGHDITAGVLGNAAHELDLSQPLIPSDRAAWKIAVAPEAGPPRGSSGRPDDVERERGRTVWLGVDADVSKGEELALEADAIFVSRPEQRQNADSSAGRPPRAALR